MTRHELDTALYDIRREIALLMQREAALIRKSKAEPEPPGRPGWPMRRVQGAPAQASGCRISTSAPERMAV